MNGNMRGGAVAGLLPEQRADIERHGGAVRKHCWKRPRACGSRGMNFEGRGSPDRCKVQQGGL